MSLSNNSSNLNVPFNINEPTNIIVALIFYSPLFLSFLILSLSFVFQNFKGILFLISLIVVVFIRSGIMKYTGIFNTFQTGDGNKLCDSIKYSDYENNTFSMFFIAFSFVYLCGPMILTGFINYWLMTSLLVYYFLDLYVRRNIAGCMMNLKMILVDTIIFGIGLGSLTLLLLNMSNNQKYMFFNETSSTKDMCSMPTKQTFKCSVYRNGELIGETNR